MAPAYGCLSRTAWIGLYTHRASLLPQQIHDLGQSQAGGLAHTEHSVASGCPPKVGGAVSLDRLQLVDPVKLIGHHEVLALEGKDKEANKCWKDLPLPS